MSRKIDHKIWECPSHLFGRQPGTRLVRLSQYHRRKAFALIRKESWGLPLTFDKLFSNFFNAYL